MSTRSVQYILHSTFYILHSIWYMTLHIETETMHIGTTYLWQNHRTTRVASSAVRTSGGFGPRGGAGAGAGAGSGFLEGTLDLHSHVFGCGSAEVSWPEGNLFLKMQNKESRQN